MHTNQKVLLSSGGMDSFLLAHQPELKGAIHLFVDIGQKYVAKERIAAKRVAQNADAEFHEFRTAQLGGFEHSSGIIPFRNAEMLLCAAQFGTEIYLGVIADEINSDKSVEFCNAMERVLNISHKKQYWTDGKEFRIHTPFRLVTKSALVRQYLIGYNSDDKEYALNSLLETVSCYDAGAKHCGRCPSCFKRWVALTNALGASNWEDWGFVENPATWKTKQNWAIAIQEYGYKRSLEITTALEIALP